MDIINKTLGSFTVDLAISGGGMTLSGTGPLGLKLSIELSEAALLDAGVKLIPAGTIHDVAVVAEGIIEKATEAL